MPANRFAVLALAVLLVGGCGPAKPSVVVYTALDQEFSEPLFAPFEKQFGVRVLANFDTEATKSVGLAGRIMVETEAGRTRCDLFWNNEILNTLRLHEKGLLRPIHPPNADEFPAEFKAADGTWYGFAARARVLVVNTKLVPDDETPRSIFDLTEAKWKGKVGIAKPLFGTTATHAACLFAKLGPDRARRFFLELKKNGVQILSSNKQVALAVAGGQLPLGLTDTDDAIGELERGEPVRLVYLDSEPDGLGTLFIPNTLAALKGSRNPDTAEKFANYLLSADVERALAVGPSAQIPLNPKLIALPDENSSSQSKPALRLDGDKLVQLRVETPATVHAMQVDWNEALKLWDETAAFIKAEFAGPK